MSIYRFPILGFKNRRINTIRITKSVFTKEIKMIKSTPHCLLLTLYYVLY